MSNGPRGDPGLEGEFMTENVRLRNLFRTRVDSLLESEWKVSSGTTSASLFYLNESKSTSVARIVSVLVEASLLFEILKFTQ